MGGSPSKRNIEKWNMILIGGPSVGKSTVVQQLRILYTKEGNSDQYRCHLKPYIFENLLQTVCHINAYIFNNTTEINVSNDYLHDAEEVEQLYDDICVLNGDTSMDNFEGNKKGTAITDEWEREAERRKKNHDTLLGPLYKHRFSILIRQIETKDFMKAFKILTKQSEEDGGVIETRAYLVLRVRKLLRLKYVPSTEMILRVRRITQEPQTMKFRTKYNGAPLEVTVTDVGAQADRQEQWRSIILDSQKSLNLKVTLYILSLSDFDVDPGTVGGGLPEQINLFESVVNSNLFADTCIVVLLNKADALEQKLKRKNAADYMDIFKGKKNTADDCIGVIEGEIKRIAQNGANKRKVVILPTCALETNLIEHAVNRILEVVTQMNHVNKTGEGNDSN